jgi:hypothetical protein
MINVPRWLWRKRAMAAGDVVGTKRAASQLRMTVERSKSPESSAAQRRENH